MRNGGILSLLPDAFIYNLKFMLSFAPSGAAGLCSGSYFLTGYL